MKQVIESIIKQLEVIYPNSYIVVRKTFFYHKKNFFGVRELDSYWEFSIEDVVDADFPTLYEIKKFVESLEGNTELQFVEKEGKLYLKEGQYGS